MIWAVTLGARPSDGSSSSSSRGRATSAPADREHLPLATRQLMSGKAAAPRERFEELVDLVHGPTVVRAILAP
jgi:hypothetical protein